MRVIKMAFNKEVIKKVLSDFENKNREAYFKNEKEIKRIHSNIPELGEISAELFDTGYKLARLIIEKNADFQSEVEKLKLRNKELIAKRKKILAENNINVNIYEPVFDCPECEDRGFIGEKRCDCLNRALAAESLRYSGLGNMVGIQTFENFDLNYYKSAEIRKNMTAVYNICRDFALNFVGNENCGNLMFIGGTGLGKSHLSTAIAEVVTKKGFEVVYDSAHNIVSNFEKERFVFSYRDRDYESKTERYLTSDMLIIDDLGVENTGANSVSTIYNIINSRLIDKKSMIISTNLTFEQINKKYDVRILSRLLGEFRTLMFSGDDVRLQKLDKND